MNTTRYNMLTQTQIKIMKLFVGNITRRFSLRGVGKELDMHQALTYRSSKGLIEKELIVQDEDKYVLNYRRNHQELAYFESLRSKEFLQKNKSIALMLDEIIHKFPYGYFCLVIFGSGVTKNKPRDLDLLMIIENTEDIEKAEKYLYNITRNYTIDTHSLIISFESVYEMLGSRDEKNVMNEVLNKHIILYGAELFYKIINKGRK